MNLIGLKRKEGKCQEKLTENEFKLKLNIINLKLSCKRIGIQLLTLFQHKKLYSISLYEDRNLSEYIPDIFLP